ncbi:MAG: alpha/beta fold hydrolase [Cyanobacteriota bacterium]|nr:alpha/beta fold hydrolase [Cyanobacteriota bacterium]
MNVNRWRCLLPACLGVGVGILSTVFTPKPALSAERIYLTYGVFELSLSVESIERFAETGEITNEFAFYAQFFNDRTLTQLRPMLQQRFEIGQVLVSQLTYSPIGETVLERFGRVVQTSAGLNGFQSIRAALILAASDPEGFTILNFLREFPSEGIRIDIRQLEQVGEQFTTLFSYRDAVLEAIDRQAESEAAAEPVVDFSQLPDLRQPGPHAIEQRTLTLARRESRGEALGIAGFYGFDADFYLPQNSPSPAPLVVISHGFGSTRSNYTYLAEHLASHGFAVALPEHIGSNSDYREALLRGELSLDINPVEFVDRPLDVRYLLDEIEKLADKGVPWAEQIDLDRVGAIGHSLGGATVLALSGASLNHARLRQECTPDNPILNVSQFLQCRAKSLPPFNYNLSDPRIRASIAINPITSHLFGPEGLGEIDLPILLMSGSEDFIAPAVPEQVHPFLWLNSPQKFLALILGGDHASTSGAPQSDFPIPIEFDNSSNLGTGQNYIKALSVAFFERYLHDSTGAGVTGKTSPYLSAAYGHFLSPSGLPLDLIRSLEPAQLESAYGNTPPEPIFPELETANLSTADDPILSEIERTGILRVGIRRDASPFGYLDRSGVWRGYCLDFAEGLANSLTEQFDRDIEIEAIGLQSTQENRFELVRNGTVHLECGPNPIVEQTQEIEFSVPFFTTGTYFITHSENAPTLDVDGSLAGVRVGVLPGTTAEEFVTNEYPEAESVYFEGWQGREEALKALARGNVDVWASDGVLLAGELFRQGLSLNDYKILPDRPLTCDFYGAILPEDDRLWRVTVNQFIASESARSIWNNWFDRALPFVLTSLDYCNNPRSVAGDRIDRERSGNTDKFGLSVSPERSILDRNF